MKTRLFTVLCLIVTLTLLLPGGVQPTAARLPTPPNELQLSAADDGRQIDLDQDKMLVINLEANPSTGYGWEVTEMDEKVLRKFGDFEYTPSSDLPGAPGTLTLRFEGVGKGLTNLKLAYHRSWEKGVEPKKTFSAKVQSKGAYKGPHNTPKVKDAPQSAPADDGATILTVPAAFNWCNQNGCTPVRDQGNCGSCWAFSTVGALESNIRIKDGLSKDLAEQYLVSCNSDGWSCNGGWWAHDYHLNKYISGEPGAGAVYESDFPYQAANVPCNPPHTHHEKIASWTYVGSSSGVPSTAAIKQAIYDHGPVSAAVYVGSAFQSYPGGVFQTNESGTVNHAIVLVGWDDTSPGYWILRNSWGAGWGESGYMRIKYGTSQVGYGANYVVYNGSGPTPTPTPTPTPPPCSPGTTTICSGASVPSGWIKTNDSWDPTRCGNPQYITYNVWTITTYCDKAERATMSVCSDAPTPAGWTQTNDSWDSTRCGHPSYITYNVKTIYKVAAADTSLTMCSFSPMPTGWIKTDDSWNSTSCGHPSYITYNVWSIQRYDNKPIGSTMTVCADQPTPSGWTVTGTSWSPTTCGHPSYITNNVKTIRRSS